MILGIYPGTMQSAYVVYDGHKIISMDIIQNDKLIEEIKTILIWYVIVAYIEDICNYGMPVGKEGFETLKFIGRLQQLCIDWQSWYKEKSGHVIRC